MIHIFIHSIVFQNMMSDLITLRKSWFPISFGWMSSLEDVLAIFDIDSTEIIILSLFRAFIDWHIRAIDVNTSSLPFSVPWGFANNPTQMRPLQPRMISIPYSWNDATCCLWRFTRQDDTCIICPFSSSPYRELLVWSNTCPSWCTAWTSACKGKFGKILIQTVNPGHCFYPPK